MPAGQPHYSNKEKLLLIWQQIYPDTIQLISWEFQNGFEVKYKMRGKNYSGFQWITINQLDIYATIIGTPSNILKKDTAHDESKVIQNVEAAQSNTNKEINGKTYKSQNQISLEKNITKNIEYITTNKEGDIFKILAEYGKTNFKNSNILDLENVNGEINSNDAPKIFIKSDYAKYNYNNQNSKFFGNVKINYENKEITCDNLDLNINENIAIAYNNVIMIDQNSKMRAENVVMDIVTKDININSKNKVEVSIN